MAAGVRGRARAQLEAVLPDAAHAAMHVEHSAWAERNSLNNTLEPSRLATLCGELREAERQRAAAEKSGDDSEQSWVGEASAALLERAAALRILPVHQAARLAPGDLRRAGRLVRALEAVPHPEEVVAAVVTVAFASQAADALHAAYDAMCGAKHAPPPPPKVRRLLAIVASHLPAEVSKVRLPTALAAVDEAEFVEFPAFTEAFRAISVASDGSGDSGAPVGVAEALSGLGNLERGLTAALSPLQMRRVGRIAWRMRQQGYEPAAVNTVVRVLFVSSSKKDMERAFALLDKDKSGSLRLDEFRTLLYVCGEAVKGEDITKWFDAVDEDKSGLLELPEFSRLMRALRRALQDGQRSTLATLTDGLTNAAKASALDPKLAATLTALDLRRAGRVVANLQAADFGADEVRVIVHAIFGQATEPELRAAFAVFDTDGEGSLDADEFREMLPLLAGEHLPFERVESLFLEADRDRSGVIEFDEFLWLLGALRVAGGAAGGGAGAVRMRSVEELKADRAREGNQLALQARVERLRSKAAALTKASQLLHLSRPLVTAQLLCRLHKAELLEAEAVAAAHDHEASRRSLLTGVQPSSKLSAAAEERESTDAAGGVLRGSSLLLRRRADVLLKAAAALAVEERPKALRHMRHALQSLDEEGPVTETAAHGVARCRGLHARADALQLLVELLSADTSWPPIRRSSPRTRAPPRAPRRRRRRRRAPRASRRRRLWPDDLASSLSTELALLQAAPQKAGRRRRPSSSARSEAAPPSARSCCCCSATNSSSRRRRRRVSSSRRSAPTPPRSSPSRRRASTFTAPSARADDDRQRRRGAEPGGLRSDVEPRARAARGGGEGGAGGVPDQGRPPVEPAGGRPPARVAAGGGHAAALHRLPRDHARHRRRGAGVAGGPAARGGWCGGTASRTLPTTTTTSTRASRRLRSGWRAATSPTRGGCCSRAS